MPDAEETVVAWTAISANCPVIASDGQEVGKVTEVAALHKEDIFHGVVFRNGLLGKHVLAPAADIDRVTDRAVYLTTTSEAAGNYPEFRELEVDRLGVSGLFFWKHLGWKKSGD